MAILNFTWQDAAGMLAGFVLFALIFIPPGYVTCFALDLFEFRSRKWFVRFGFALLLSSAIAPVMFFLAYRLVSEMFAFIVMFAFAFVFTWQVLREKKFSSLFAEIQSDKRVRVFLSIALVWIVLAAFSLIDLQFGKRLYFNITAFDYQTRVSVINAITRTGVPPLNPSYHPGAPIKLTFLYYFWYILCSLVDKLGGNIVDSRMALAASVIWAGLALMGTVALYLRIRNTTTNIWRSALMGIGLLAVSGLDIFPSTLYMAFPQLLYGYFIDGDIEHWNEQITAWVGSTLWTPHHLVSLLNCVLGIMLIAYHKDSKPLQKFGTAVIAGIAFASAFGLSSWVTMIFVIFWAVWFVMRLVNKETLKSVSVMVIPGIVATIAILPFILDLFGGGSSGSSGSFPLGFDVRAFRPALILTTFLPNWQRALVNLLLLPLNYFLELGFFFFAGIIWYKLHKKGRLPDNKFAQEEIALLAITVLLTSLTRSTLISNNDFGWRGWLPGQFVLLIWGTDVLSYLWKNKPVNLKLLLIKPSPANQIKFSLLLLLALGALTSVQDVVYLRIWPILVDTGILVLPEPIRSDEYMGTKNFEARTLYSIIETNYPEDTIVQFNPLVGLDRPSGLYRTRSVMISYHTLYGVPPELYKPLARKMSQLFTTQSANWETVDATCQQDQINIVVFTDTDEIWAQVPKLTKTRQPIFSGKYYSAFECGK
jgi:hypothetical protein